MKIYESSERVDSSSLTTGWYQLRAINQWDMDSMAVCARKTGSYDSVGAATILYALDYYGAWGGAIEIQRLTDEMKDCLRSMGYMVGGSE